MKEVFGSRDYVWRKGQSLLFIISGVKSQQICYRNFKDKVEEISCKVNIWTFWGNKKRQRERDGKLRGEKRRKVKEVQHPNNRSARKKDKDWRQKTIN